ncbi:MAG: hypothetical protein AB8B74_04155 [Crocinitomicaceae bacterium]
MHLNKNIFIGIFCILLANSIFGQEKNYFSFEAAGSGGFGSLNYEKPVYSKSKLTLNFRVGFSFTPIDPSNGTNLIFPIMLHSLFGAKDHKLDLAIGQAITITTRASFYISAPLAIGYRYQPSEKNYFLRLAYTPLISYLLGVQWQNWAGFTYGYHFNRK